MALNKIVFEMKIGLISKLKNSLFLSIVLGISCSSGQTAKEMGPKLKLNEGHFKVDWLWIADSTKTNKNHPIKFVLYEFPETDTPGYLYLIAYSTKGRQTRMKLPGSYSYGFGSGFSNEFDRDGLIAKKIKRNNSDFIVSSFGKRESLFYYFTVTDSNKVTLEKIFKLFRYSNNYGVEPEQMELSQFNISMNINDSDLVAQSELKLKKGIPDAYWLYRISPGSDKIIPVRQ